MARDIAGYLATVYGASPDEMVKKRNWLTKLGKEVETQLGKDVVAGIEISKHSEEWLDDLRSKVCSIEHRDVNHYRALLRWNQRTIKAVAW